MVIDGLTAARVEEMFLLCTAPREQLAYDGWLVRRAQNDIKRASSVNAFYGSTKPISEKIEHVEALYGEAGLRPLFRLTPLSQPANLDSELAGRGYERIEASLVQVNRLSRPLPPAPEGVSFESMLLERWVEESGRLRGRPRERIEAQFRRLHEGEAPGYCSMAYVGSHAVACGLVMHEEDLAGLFDVFVTESQRGRGIGTAISAHLLTTARRMGAQRGWLSVLADNEPALAAYAKLGFETLYEYWYRVRR